MATINSSVPNTSVPLVGTSSADAHGHQHGHDEKQHAHVVSPRLLLGVYCVLMFLTLATVAVTQVDLGPFNIYVALFIAVVKAGLVALFFMHLRWDAPFNGVIILIALFFVALFIGTTILDSTQYKPNFSPPGGGQVVTPSDREPHHGQ